MHNFKFLRNDKCSLMFQAQFNVLYTGTIINYSSSLQGVYKQLNYWNIGLDFYIIFFTIIISSVHVCVRTRVCVYDKPVT